VFKRGASPSFLKSSPFGKGGARGISLPKSLSISLYKREKPGFRDFLEGD
jgi:hypothetical protein